MKHIIHTILLVLLTLVGVTSCNREDDPIPEPQITDTPILDTSGLNTDSSGNISVDTVSYTFPLGVILPDSGEVNFPSGYKIKKNTYTVSINEYLIGQDIIPSDILQVFVTDKSTNPFFSIDIRSTQDDVLVDLICSRDSYQTNTHEILTTIVTTSTIYTITCTMDLLPTEVHGFVAGLTKESRATLTEPNGYTRTQDQAWPLNSIDLTVHSYSFTHRYSFNWTETDYTGYLLGDIPTAKAYFIDFAFLQDNYIVININNINYIAQVLSSDNTTAYIKHQGTIFTLHY